MQVPSSAARDGSAPMRRALDPVTRYNERLNRARSSKNLAHKLPPTTSPAPRSPSKARPFRELSQRENNSQRDKSPPREEASPVQDVPSFKRNPFLMADGINKNPFRSKVGVRPPPPSAGHSKVHVGRAAPPKAPSRAPEQPEPRPIGKLSDAQIADLRLKRQSIPVRRPSLLHPPTTTDPNAADGEAEVQQPEVVAAGEAEVSVEAEVLAADDEAEETVQHENEDADDEAEAEMGVQVAPFAPEAAMPPAAVKASEARETTTATTTKKTEAAVSAPATAASCGDLSFLQAGGHADLAAALALMLPNLDAQLLQARAAAATSEPLLDILRRSQQRVGKSKRPRSKK